MTRYRNRCQSSVKSVSSTSVWPGVRVGRGQHWPFWRRIAIILVLVVAARIAPSLGRDCPCTPLTRFHCEGQNCNAKTDLLPAGGVEEWGIVVMVGTWRRAGPGLVYGVRVQVLLGPIGQYWCHAPRMMSTMGGFRLLPGCHAVAAVSPGGTRFQHLDGFGGGALGRPI